MAYQKWTKEILIQKHENREYGIIIYKFYNGMILHQFYNGIIKKRFSME